jgi:hypothetical protein
VRPLPVRPGFGPTLPELLPPRLRRPALLALALLGVLLVVLALGRRDAGEQREVVREPIAFNLRHADTLPRVKAGPGELLRLEQRRGASGLFLQSFAVTALTLPPYAGSPGGELPIVAEGLKHTLGERFRDVALVREGRMRINEQPGYEVVFTARSAAGRRLYGRWVMLVPGTDPPTPQRRGITLQLLGTPAAGIPNGDSTGDAGGLKLPLRSFRFGTEAP